MFIIFLTVHHTVAARNTLNRWVQERRKFTPSLFHVFEERREILHSYLML